MHARARWQATLLCRATFEDWNSNLPSELAAPKNRVDDILANHRPLPLPAGEEQAVAEIVAMVPRSVQWLGSRNEHITMQRDTTARMTDQMDTAERPTVEDRPRRASSIHGVALLVARSSLAPAARSLLESAAKILEAKGYSGLTLRAIERTSGVNKGLIQYYFGGKPGMLVALADWLQHDVGWPLRAAAASTPPGEARLQQSIHDIPRSLLSDSRYYRLFFTLFPHLMDDPEARARVADLYSGYRELMAEGLLLEDEDPSEAQADLGALAIAVHDGLALQMLADSAIDIDRLFNRWEAMLRHALHEAGPQEPT